jgi:two-component system, cell cycle sensor histidine kinase and response regulator CckA
MIDQDGGPLRGGTAGEPPASAALTLQSILDSIQDVFYRIDGAGRISLVSRSGAIEMGYARPEELVGRPAGSLWRFPERRFEMLAALRRDGLVHDWEFELVRVDGTPFWAATSVHLLRDADGREVGYQGIWRNIAERKAAEARILQSEQKFSQIFRTVPDTIVVSRARDGLLLDVNPGFEAATGWRRDDALGRSTVELDLWTSVEARDRMVADLRAHGEVLDREFAFRRRDGTARQGLFSARTFDLGGELCVVFIMRDITERGEAAAARLVQEQRFRLAIEGANLGTWDWTPASNHVAVNARWSEMLGHRPDEVEDAYTFWETRIHPEDRERVFAALNQYLAGTAPHYETEHRLRHRDGHWVWVLARGRAIERDPAGKVLRISGTHLDVSERKALEADRARMEVQLRQAQKLEAVGQVAGGVAHDFNNLLTVQLGCLGLLAELDGLPAEARGLLQEIERSAGAAAALTRQLLAFSRRQVLQPRRVDLNDVVGTFLGMLRRVVREDVRLDLQPSSRPLWLEADPGMLEQVVMNLAVNARDAMPAGGRLTLTCDAVEVGPGHDAAPGPYARLVVADTGHGMDEVTQRHIFEPFFTTKPAGHGTGLGLATVYGIVKQHGGFVEVESRIGAGTTFLVHFPLAPGAAPGEQPPAPEALVSGHGEAVLLVEDDPAVRRTLKGWLGRLGYRTVACADGPEALASWRERAGLGGIDLLLTDMVMPGGLSGLDLVALLRAEVPDLPVVVMTGYSAELAGSGLPEGTGFLPKPAEPLTLARTLRAELERRRR